MSRLRRAGRRRRRSYPSTKHQSVTSPGGTVFFKASRASTLNQNFGQGGARVTKGHYFY